MRLLSKSRPTTEYKDKYSIFSGRPVQPNLALENDTTFLRMLKTLSYKLFSKVTSYATICKNTINVCRVTE